VIGELYLIMESAANFQLEEKLIRMGIELHRWVSATSILHHGLTGARTSREMLRLARPYARYHVGAHGTESIARVNQMIHQGFDGAIHLKPFGCMPDINALPALHRMCREHRFPLVSLSFDSHTAETGVQTRLEAFYDMLACKRQGGMLCMSAT
jgi:predicted nucleotide-binding protein (sugar kinase/HSP70/actin superfamily)